MVGSELSSLSLPLSLSVIACCSYARGNVPHRCNSLSFALTLELRPPLSAKTYTFCSFAAREGSMITEREKERMYVSSHLRVHFRLCTVGIIGTFLFYLFIIFFLNKLSEVLYGIWSKWREFSHLSNLSNLMHDSKNRGSPSILFLLLTLPSRSSCSISISMLFFVIRFNYNI